MIYITEKERFYSKSWLGAKKLDCVHAYVYENTKELDAIQKQLVRDGITGTLREYSVAGWKELMSRPNVWYRPSAAHEFVSMDKCGPVD